MRGVCGRPPNSKTWRMKNIVKKLLWRMGFDLIRAKHSPRVNLLGLRRYPIRSILDIGANIGQFARRMRAEFPDADLYCFEPLPQAFESLSAWARQQGGLVTTFNVAVGDAVGKIQMYHHINHSPSSSILRTTGAAERLYDFTKRQALVTVEQVTLDSVMDQLDQPLRQKILIKADVQGYEDRVIRGGEATFTQAFACILEVDVEELYQGQASFEQLVVLLRDRGFQYAGNLLQTLGNDGHVIFLDALFLKH